ncbi:MAG TPA: hypothetical protein ENN09_05150 [Planctomycetes bacterium]|nr:hypothetical protein [Planctomycetota bacterium]
MTSRERLLAVMRGDIPDRVPVSTYELVGWNSRAWENHEPSYGRLMDCIRAKTDCIAMWNPSGAAEGIGGAFMSWTDSVTLSRETRAEDSRSITTTVVHTPKGDLTAVTARDPDVHTTWTLKHFCETAEDVRKFLSISYKYAPPDFSGLPRIRQEVGEHGIVMPSIADPLCHAAELFAMSDFTVFAFTEKALFREVLDAFFPRVMDALVAMLKAGAGDMYRIVGPEYASEPYLPPRLFDEFVTPYDSRMVELIHEHGRYARLHCHGRLCNVLDSIAATGCDGIDPAEPPPDGDITIAEIRGRFPKLGIFGNIELKLLEHGTKDDVQRAVAAAINEGKPGGRFCLMPTAAPINIPLARKTEENYLAYIDTALELGGY